MLIIFLFYFFAFANISIDIDNVTRNQRERSIHRASFCQINFVCFCLFFFCFETEKKAFAFVEKRFAKFPEKMSARLICIPVVFARPQWHFEYVPNRSLNHKLKRRSGKNVNRKTNIYAIFFHFVIEKLVRRFDVGDHTFDSFDTRISYFLICNHNNNNNTNRDIFI